jgi:hypothetical protein
MTDYFLPEWILFQVSGRRPLDAFNTDIEENAGERKRKHLYSVHKENIDLI